MWGAQRFQKSKSHHFFEPLIILRSSQQELSYRLDPQETLLVKSSEPKIKKLLWKKANKNRSQGPILNETSNPQSLMFCYMHRWRKQILQMQLWTSSLLISGSFLDEISNSGVDFGSQLQQRSILNSLPLCVLTEALNLCYPVTQLLSWL